MSINKRVLNHIKRKVNENRLRDKVSDILDNTLPSIIREVRRGPSPKQLKTKDAEEFVDQIDQDAALDDTVTEAGNHLQNKVYDAVTGMSTNAMDDFEGKFAIKRGKLNDFIFKLSDRDARGILKLIKQRKFEGKLRELDVRKTHGNKRIKNAATGNNIKLRTALKAKKGSAVYAKGKAMYNALKDTPANESVKGKLEKLKELLDTNVNERAYASTDGKPTFDYDPGESKLTEALNAPKKFTVKKKIRVDGNIYNPGIYILKKKKAGGGIYLNTNNNEMLGAYTGTLQAANSGFLLEGKLTEENYKYKKQVANAFKKINDEMFKFRHSMGLKQLTNKDRKLKNKVESLQMAIFDLQKEMKKDGLTEGKLTEVKIGDMVKIDKAYGGGKGKVEDKKGSFIVVNGSSYHETDVKVVYESNLTEAKLRKGDWIRSAYDELGLVNKVKGQAAYVSFDGSRSFQPMRVADLKKTKERYKGKAVFAEGKLTEAKDQKLAKLFQASKLANVKMGEDKLYKLSQAWERWNVDNDDKYDNLVDPLFAAIELVQDAGQPGKNNVVKDKEYYSYIKSADKHLKQFNKDVIKAMREHK